MGIFDEVTVKVYCPRCMTETEWVVQFKWEHNIMSKFKVGDFLGKGIRRDLWKEIKNVSFKADGIGDCKNCRDNDHIVYWHFKEKHALNEGCKGIMIEKKKGKIICLFGACNCGKLGKICEEKRLGYWFQDFWVVVRKGKIVRVYKQDSPIKFSVHSA